MSQQVREIGIWALASHLRDQLKEAAQTGAVWSDSEGWQTWYPTRTPGSSPSPPYCRAGPLWLLETSHAPRQRWLHFAGGISARFLKLSGLFLHNLQRDAVTGRGKG